MRIFVVGYPGDVGGASTELWHTLKLWRKSGVEVDLLTTCQPSPRWRALVDEIGCTTHVLQREDLNSVEKLAGSIVVSFCNSEFLTNVDQLRAMSCRLVWANCMTWLFDEEKKLYAESGVFDAYMFQSEFQRDLLERGADLLAGNCAAQRQSDAGSAARRHPSLLRRRAPEDLDRNRARDGHLRSLSPRW